jgi:copper chaperone CopZ
LATAAAALALAASSDVLAALNRRGGGGETTATTPLPPMLLLPPLVAAPLRRALAPLNLPPVLRAYLDAVTLPPPPPPPLAPKKVALRVKGIRCEACAARVRGALQRVPGVLNATVDVDRGEAVAYVMSGSDEEQDELVAAVEGLKAGYEAEVLEVDGRGDD